MTSENDSVPNQIKEAQKVLETVKNEIHKVVVGQHHLIECLLIGLLADGHILLEGVPGIAKTLAANTLAKTLKCDFKRIQFTPDLLPADLTGTPIYNNKENVFEVKKGPIFTNILLADEINRAPSKVQSALLEVMQEKQVTIGGITYLSPRPFLVIATQNPIEQEGTYPLAEAQTDRFMMKVKLSYPSKEDEKIILEKMGTLGPTPQANAILDMNALMELRKLVDTIYLDDRVVEYLLNIVQATRYPTKYQIPVEGFLEYGASPRAALALKQASKARALLNGRYFVTPEDIKEIAPSILRHRIRLSYEGEAENYSTDDIIRKILDHLVVP
ncbi:MAG: MoxR family ATPase [Parachlamydiaceae bacterium]|nr:MoxR family ATPase [Parachlamydiaceae bacterium]